METKRSTGITVNRIDHWHASLPQGQTSGADGVTTLFKAKTEDPVTIISVYQVVEKFTKDKGSFTTAAQQRSLPFQYNKISLPRSTGFHFKGIFETSSHQLKDQHNEILVIGDFNERLGDNLNGTAQLAAEFSLTDILWIQHPHLQDPATYIRGKKRLDFALGSQIVAQAGQECRFEQFNYRFHTDHRAMFIDFDTKALFGSATQQLCHHHIKDIALETTSNR
jgi:hypothetical protein